MPYAHCDRCRKNQYECTCPELPRRCECGAVIHSDDLDMRWCEACWQDEQEYRFAEWVDARAKMKEGDQC